MIFKNILRFFNLLSHDNRLSLSNVLFYVAMVMYIVHPQLETISALLITLLNYSHKRYVNNTRSVKQETLDDVKERIQNVENNVEKIDTTVLDVSDKVGSLNVAMNRK